MSWPLVYHFSVLKRGEIAVVNIHQYSEGQFLRILARHLGPLGSGSQYPQHFF
jgi:hypothetical protein